MITDVYISLEAHQLMEWPGGYGKPWTLDVFKFIADQLKKQFSGAQTLERGEWVSLKALQVGMSDLEAIAIVNQRSQCILPVIVHVTLDDSNLLETKQSEKDLYPGIASARTTKFPCLKADTTLSADQIVSFRPMRPGEVGIALSRKSGQDLHLEEWPGMGNDTKGLVKRSDFEARPSATTIPRSGPFFSPVPDSPRACSSTDNPSQHLSSP